MSSLTDIRGIGPALARAIETLGITGPEALATTAPATLTQVRGISSARAQGFIAAARALTQRAPGAPTADPEPVTAPVNETDKTAGKKSGKTEKTAAKKKSKPGGKASKTAEKKSDQKSAKTPKPKKADKKKQPAKADKASDKSKKKTGKSGKKKSGKKKKSSK